MDTVGSAVPNVPSRSVGMGVFYFNVLYKEEQT